MKKFFQRNPLFSIVMIPIVVDVVGTVLGQPPVYWSSGFQTVNEALPIYPLLQIHPLVFIVACLGFWLPVTYWLIRKLRKPLDLWATLALLVGHGYNSVAWLRTDLVRAGLIQQNQTSQALGLIPVVMYILGISWIATQGILAYWQQTEENNVH